VHVKRCVGFLYASAGLLLTVTCYYIYVTVSPVIDSDTVNDNMNPIQHLASVLSKEVSYSVGLFFLNGPSCRVSAENITFGCDYSS
jgi:hypothetical protein